MEVKLTKKKSKMLTYHFKFEGARIFERNRNIAFFIIFSIIGLFFVYSGIGEYKNFQGKKELFVAHEKAKALDRLDGFSVLYEPSALSVFFNNSSVFENLHSNVDMTEVLEVDRSYKGRYLFLKKGFFKDIAGIFFLFGSFFMVNMGAASYKSERFGLNFENIVMRMAIISSLFMGSLICFYHVPKIFGVAFSASEGKTFFSFSLYLLVFLCFFYAAGLFIRVISKSNRIPYLYVFIFWFFSISVIPEVMTFILQGKARGFPENETYSIAKFKEIANLNKGANWEKVSKIEKDLNRDIAGASKAFEVAASIYPTGFYRFLSGEVSSKGYYGYLDFVNYTLTMRKNFAKYYLEKRHKSHDKKIASFITEGKNIFKASGRLPGTFSIGCILTFIYTVLLFFASYLILSKRSKQMPDIKCPRYRFNKGDTYFVLCKNDKYRDDLFRWYQEKENAICIENVAPEEIDPGIGLMHTFTYFCKIAGVDEKQAAANLRLLGIEDMAELQLKDKAKASPEMVLKIYCAVSMAGNRQIIVVKEFLKGKSRDLEHCFLHLVKNLNHAGKIIVYLSTEMFLTASPFKGIIKIDNYKNFRIDPWAVSLR